MEYVGRVPSPPLDQYDSRDVVRLYANTISGARAKGVNGGGWEHDFALTYRRAG